MLKLFEGGFFSSLHDEMIAAITRAVDTKKRVYLIVPEQQTVVAECEMSELFTPAASLHFEVTNFTRFTNTAFRELGGISGEYSTPVTKSLIMWRVLTELSPSLAMTERKREIAPGIVNKAVVAVGEMQALGISPDELGIILAMEISNKRLYEKLNDLYQIYNLYTKTLAEKYNDAANDCKRLVEAIYDNPGYLQGTEIFIEGFTSFTEPQYRLIQALAGHTDVTLALPIDHICRSAFEYREVLEARNRLVNGKGSDDIRKSSHRVARHKPGTSELLSSIAEMLWSIDGEIDNYCLQEYRDVPGRVRIFAAPTSYEECEFIAQDIKRRVMEGDSPSDFAIVARDIKPYIGVLDIALDEARLPYFVSKADDVSSTSLVKFISTAYAIVAGGFHLESVITYMKSGLLPISEEERDELELYLEKWRVGATRLENPMPFNMNPRGIERMTDTDRLALERINATKEKVLSPLYDLKAEISKAKTVKEHALALITFLTKSEIPGMLKSRAATLAGYGEIALSDETLRLWGAVCDALDVVVDVLGDVEADSDSFLNQVKVALGGVAIGRIPSYRDVITIGSADMLRISEKKHVYLIGTNAGVFPATVSENSYFTEQDKATLKRLGLGIQPDLDVKCAKEYYYFSRAFAKARESVTLVFAERTAMAKPIKPSEAVGKIVSLLSGNISVTKTTSIDIYDRLYTPEAALSALRSLDDEDKEAAVEALTELGLEDKIEIASGSVRNIDFTVGEDTIALLFGKDLYLSESKISSFTSCPMKFFFNYGVRLEDRGEAEIDSLVIGSFVHGVVEKVFRDCKRRKIKLSEMSAEDRDRLTEECAKQYVSEIFSNGEDTASNSATITRLSSATKPVIDGLARELVGSKYEPKFFELKIDARNGDAPDPIVLDDGNGGRIVLGGVIDRVDTYKSGDDVYVKIADYKTGKIEFLPSKLEEGEYLQMFLYLRAITETKSKGFLDKMGVGEGGRLIPGGVIYVKTQMQDETIRQESEEDAKVSALYNRDGMLLANEDSIEAMNPEFLPPMPEKPTATFQSRLYSEDEWKEISDTVEEVVYSIAGEIRSGSVKSTPAAKKVKSCNYCPYKEICRNAKIIKTYN